MAFRHHGDRCEILDRIVRQVLEGIGIGDQRGRGREQERVTVRSSSCDRLGTDDVCRAWAVLDNELLSKATRELVGDDTAKNVGAVPAA